jgi:flagellar basal-body rod protein FlgG
MLRGLYTATAGLIANQRRHDTVSNNIANINTPGYKAKTTVTRSFPEMLITMVGGGDGSNDQRLKIGRLHTGVFAEEAPSLFKSGSLIETRNMSDFAIVSDIQVPGARFDESGKYVTPEGESVFQPQAMFAVNNENDEERYTRNGNFIINAAGELVTSDGHRVLDAQRNPIQLDPGISEIRVGEGGTVYDALTNEAVVGPNGQPVNLFIARIENPNQLIREGNGNFRLNEGNDLPPAINPEDNVQVLQGFLEQSNVDAAQSMVELMAAQRAYETNQRMVQFYDRSLEKAVNEVGRV